MLVLLDTNLWVSSLIRASMRTLIMRLIADENLVILADATLLSELEDVIL